MEYAKVDKSNIDALFKLNRALAIAEGQEDLFTVERENYEKGFLVKNPVVHGILAFDEGEPIGFGIYLFKFATYLGRRILHIEDIYMEGTYMNSRNTAEFLAYFIKLMKREECCRLEMRVLHELNIGLTNLQTSGFQKITKWDVYRLES